MSFLTASADVSATSETLTGLANSGVPGVIVLLIVAIVVMSCFFFWVTYKRESRREKDYLNAEIEKNRTLTALTNAIKEFVFVMEHKFEGLKHKIDSLGEEIGETNGGMVTVLDKIKEHDHRLDDHDDILETLTPAVRRRPVKKETETKE